jgi:uncharacterized protein (DUF1800 family)
MNLPTRTLRVLACLILATTLALGGCGGGSSSSGGSGGNGNNNGGGNGGGTPPAPMTARDAVRLAHQASFGPTESMLAAMRSQTAEQWVAAQIAAPAASRYVSGQGDAIHRNTQATFFCDLPARAGPNCWRDWYSAEPLVWDFYRNAVNQPDQLRQRVAWAMAQWLVISNHSVHGTYGLRNYHNMLLDQAFGNYREVLRRVTLAPTMGQYLNHVNNDRAAPNENFARELLQLFAIGTCRLDANGALTGGRCQPTYGNPEVRAYAYALTGWTYAPGGSTAWGCWPEGTNCEYLGADMVPAAAALRDTEPRALLSGVTVPANSSAPQALERVLDSLMAHPNIGPFVARHLIQHLVTSNPTPAYVGRVAAAFDSGRFGAIGAGQKGDLAATVAAVLLDAEARSETPARSFGRLREPVQHFAGVLRALGGRTDGAALSWWWGEALTQHAFMAPSVFNFYPPDYPVPGSTLVGPAFGIHNANTALARMNYLVYLLDWNGSQPDASVPGAVGTQVDLAPWIAAADDATALVDRLSQLALGAALPEPARSAVVQATAAVTQQSAGNDWRKHRASMAAYLVFTSPQYQIVR